MVHTSDNIYVVDTMEAVLASYLVRLQLDKGQARVVGEFMRSPEYFSHVKDVSAVRHNQREHKALAAAAIVFDPDSLADKFYQKVRSST